MASSSDDTNPTPYLEAADIADAFNDSWKWMKQYWDPIPEFERIARNKPSPNIPAELPNTTDGSTSALVQDQPKRTIQQIPTGKTNSKSSPEYAAVAGYVLTDKLIPYANTDGTVLQKGWAITSKVLTQGCQGSYSWFCQNGDEFCVDYSLPYYRDIGGMKGIVNLNNSPIDWMRSWWQKPNIKRLIAKEQRLQSLNKNYISEWNLKYLSDLIDLDNATAKPTEDMNPAERENYDVTGGYEIIHILQKGYGAEFYSYSPKLGKDKLLRRKKNPDPRGNMPLDFMYCNLDLSNPMGRGIVETSAPIQNLMDQQMAMFQFMNTMGMAPAVAKYGNPNTRTWKMLPNAIWDMGNNPINKYEVVKLDTTAIAQFPTNYGLLRSQLLNLNAGGGDSSTSASVGNPGFSKTDAGVNALQSRLNIADNYIRKQYEEWQGAEFETMLNLYFSEMEGNGTLDIKEDMLEPEDAKALVQFATGKDDVLHIPYSKINDVVFEFQVDASSSEIKEDSDNEEKLTNLLQVAGQLMTPQQQQGLIKKIAEETGVEGIDEIFPDAATEQTVDPATGMPVDPNQPMQPITAGQPDGSLQGMPTAQPMPQELPMQPPAPVEPMPPQMPEQPQQDPQEQAEEAQLTQEMQQIGLDQNDIEQAITMLRSGVPAQQIIQAIQAKYGGQNG